MAHHIVPAAEEYIDKQISVLDHGFVTLIDYMGSDAAIVEAARTSIAGEGAKATSIRRIALAPPHVRPAHLSLRDGRDEVPLQDAHLRGSAVDPASDRERERDVWPIQRAARADLRARPRAGGLAEPSQQAGQRGADPRGHRPGRDRLLQGRR